MPIDVGSMYQNRAVFGHDWGSTLWPTSTWYPVYVDDNGLLHITGTVTTGTITATVGGTLDVDIKTLGGSVVAAGPLPVDVYNWYAVSTLDVDIKTLGGSVVPAGPLPVDIGTISVSVGTVAIGGTLDVDIKTLGGSVVPAGPLPVDIENWNATSTLDVDIKTLGGSVVPAGPLPVDVMNTATITGTVTTDLAGTLDVDIKTLGGSVVPAGPLPVDIENWNAVSTLDVDIKTLGGSVVPAGPLPVDVMSGIFAGTQDVDIKTVGGSLLPSGNLPVDVENTVNIIVTSTADVDIKTLGGSVVPAGPLPVDIISGGVTGTQDVDIKTLGGSVVPAGPLPVDFAGTITATVGGTLDVDIKTIGGSVVASGPLPVDIISGGITGTADVDIKTIGGSVIPSGNLPINNYVTDSTNWYGWRAAEAWGGGTESTPTTHSVPDVAIVGRYAGDTSGTLQAIRVDTSGNLEVVIDTAAVWPDFDGRSSIIVSADPIGAAHYVYNNVAGDWDRSRSAESMVSSTIGDQGLLAIGEFGYDGSDWRYKAVNSSGYTIVTGTVDTGMTGTIDVDIKTIGGSVVAAGPLPVDFAGTLLTGTITAIMGGTLDVDIKTIGGSVIPSGNMPINNYVDDGSGSWYSSKSTQALAGGTIDTGLLAVGRVPPADPVEKTSLFTAAASTVAVWTPTAGKRWNLTDFVISVKNASDVTLHEGASTIKAEFYLAAGGGVVMDLQTPFVATGTNVPLRISLTSATVSITTSGYETL